MRFDFTAIIIIGLFLWIGHRRGLLLTAVGLINTLISTAIAFLMIRPVTGWLQNTGLFGSSLKSVTDRLHEGAQTVPDGLAPLLESLGMPESWTRKLLQLPVLSGQGALDSAAVSVWQLVLGALSLILVFSVVRVALGLTARLLTPVLNGIPVLGWLNRTGGLVLGLLWGVLTIWLLTMILTSFSLTSDRIHSLMENSQILAFLSEKDIFRSLLDTVV
ncbi:MAG TPA: hypothetical protein GX720_02915 [Clostridiaceae bacterium]|nr:hypothetical protein [Clostridiaceae bacterium]